MVGVRFGVRVRVGVGVGVGVRVRVTAAAPSPGATQLARPGSVEVVVSRE